MAEDLKCKCGAGPFVEKDLRVHILQGAKADGRGIHGWPIRNAGILSESQPSADELAAPMPVIHPNGHSDLELEQMKAMLAAFRVELNTLKDRVDTTQAMRVMAQNPELLKVEVPAVDQEAVNLAQLDAMLGIDQPGPLDKKEEEIVAAVKERTERAPQEYAGLKVIQPAPEEPQEKKGIARGWYLIIAAVAVIGIVVVVMTQM